MAMASSSTGLPTTQGVEEHDADAITDLDTVDNGLNARLSEGRIADGDVFAHDAAKAFGHGGIEDCGRSSLGLIRSSVVLARSRAA
jgi:hypothetical protein